LKLSQEKGAGAYVEFRKIGERCSRGAGYVQRHGCAKTTKTEPGLKRKDKEIKHLIERVHTAEGKELFTKAEEINGIKFINAVFPPRDPSALIIAVDAMRSFNKPFVAALEP